MNRHCTLLANGFDGGVQFLLGICAISSLYIKRQRECPQRPLQIWALDASKQGLAAGLAHVVNLGLALFMADYTNNTKADECDFYFINGVVDTSIGVFIIYVLLQSVKKAAIAMNWTSLITPGYYGSPPKWRTWFIQFWSWACIVVVTKCIMGVLIFTFKDVLGPFADYILRPLHPAPRIELLLVMLVFPTLMSSIQFWIQDNFIKYDNVYKVEAVPLLD